MIPTTIKRDNLARIALIKSEMITDYEIDQITNIFQNLRYERKKIELFQIESIDSFSIGLDFDLLLCIHDSDVLNMVRDPTDLPPLLCIELPGDHSFFSQFALNNLQWALTEYLNDNYILDSRSLLLSKIGNESYTGLNDIHITSSAINKRIRYDIRINDESLYTDGSDSANAILVSTPTGSTAMSFNLGGAVIHPQALVFQIISIASRNITTHHQIVSQESTIEIEILEAIFPLVVNIDNYQFETHETLFQIKKAPELISFITFLEKNNNMKPQNKLKAKLSFEDTHSLTSTAKFLLYILKNLNKSCTINELIDTTHIQNQKTIRSALNLLISKGFVKRRENLIDMREYLYYYSFAENNSPSLE